jgi:hypothetical protein
VVVQYDCLTPSRITHHASRIRPWARGRRGAIRTAAAFIRVTRAVTLIVLATRGDGKEDPSHDRRPVPAADAE